jgi:eukaryotic-like serine/threonine-protein kinase
MGAVYRARDSKLGREVAIKILPRLFITDPDRLARFERDARVLASLNHPSCRIKHYITFVMTYSSTTPRRAAFELIARRAGIL